MFIRSLTRWTMATAFAFVALTLTLLLVAQPTAQARPQAATTSCAGPIQACIDAATDGDTIVIDAGTYTESLTLSKPVSLTGVNSATTIIHAVAGQRVLTVTGATITNSVVISGLTFTGGNVFNGRQCPDDCGGGISLINGAQPIIQNTIIRDNTGVYGGGLYSDNVFVVGHVEFNGNEGVLYGGGAFAANAASVSGTQFESNSCSTKGCQGGGLTVGIAPSTTGQLVISNSVFVGNVADNGSGAIAFRSTTVNGGRFEDNVCGSYLCGTGALVVDGSSNYSLTLEISDVQFIGNNAAIAGSGAGGAVYFMGGGKGRIVNALFAQNTAAEQGAAIFLNWGSDTTILHSTIASVNLNPQSAIAVYAGSVLHITDTIVTSHAIGIINKAGAIYQDYNLFFGVLTQTAGVITDGGHSLIGDPKFVDPLNGDYHLQFGSAAIDRGADAGVYTDLDGQPRPHGAGFDIGAYEYQALIQRIYLPLIRKNS